MVDMNSYRFNSETDPTDEQLSQLMREVANDARESNIAATAAYFGRLNERIMQL